MFIDEKIADIRTKNELETVLHTRSQFQSFTCLLCNAVMFQQKELATHMETHVYEKKVTKKSIDRPKSHKCTICDYITSHKGTLTRHIDSIHNQCKPHKCPM